MKLISQREIANLTEYDRETVRKRLEGLAFQKGPKRSQLYDSAKALRLVFSGGNSELSPQDQLALKRTEQIDLDMEVTRGERIPLADAEECNDRAITNCAGILKSHEGKTLTPALIQDLFAELRTMGEALKK